MLMLKSQEYVYIGPVTDKVVKIQCKAKRDVNVTLKLTFT
jgi:hypothetical protein